jgi:lipoyl(octanoyl) transferase
VFLESRTLLVRHLGLQPYQHTWEAMRLFTDQRQTETLSEIWLLQHPSVFTLGQAGRREHLLNPGEVPVIQTDRGGQVTYHAPGQLIAYLLLNLKEAALGVKQLVQSMELAVIALLAERGVQAQTRKDAPGVYVDGAKIASLGLRIRKGCSYHGLSLNIDLDLEPFQRINPCGYAGLAITSLKALGHPTNIQNVENALQRHLCQQLGYIAQICHDPWSPLPGATQEHYSHDSQ